MINSICLSSECVIQNNLYVSIHGYIEQVMDSCPCKWFPWHLGDSLFSFLCVVAVGLKPTWGLVPHTGAIGLAYMIDHVGPMAKNVEDCALLLEVSRRRNDRVIYTTDRYVFIWTAQFTSFVVLTLSPRGVGGCQWGPSLTLRFLFSVAI